MCAKPVQGAGVDAAAARIAAQQHGVVSIAQLAAAGLSSDHVRHRVDGGRLHRVHRGVYAVGHPALSNEAGWMAAVLACGPGALLSHRSAASLWGLLSVISGPVHVTIPRKGGRGKRRGIHLHRSTTLTPTHATRRKNIPVTTPARTIADLGRTAPPPVTRRAVRQAELLGLRLGPGIEFLGTRSDLEDRFLRLCRRHHVARPEVNAKVGEFEVDFLWRDRRLIVELDSFRFHGTRSGFETDRARDVRLKLLGYEVLRFTDRQLDDDPAAIASALRTWTAASGRADSSNR